MYNIWIILNSFTVLKYNSIMSFSQKPCYICPNLKLPGVKNKSEEKEEGGSYVWKFTFNHQENEKSVIETIHYLFFISSQDNLYLIDITSQQSAQSSDNNQSHCLLDIAW